MEQGGFLAEEINKIYRNLDRSNRTGHLKQGYYGTQRFFQEYPHLKADVANASLDEPFDLSDSIRDDWLRFIGDFRDESSDAFDYNFNTLGNYLTAQYGWRRRGGGGGDYPFKLVWPLVARLMSQ